MKQSPISVLDKGVIELISVTGDESSIVSAARASFQPKREYTPEQDTRLLLRLLKDRHTSPFEMAEVAFKVKAPVVVWWQWVRHRTWSYSFQSGRYTAFEGDDFYIPLEWRLQSVNNKQGSEGTATPVGNALMTMEMERIIEVCYKSYMHLLASGVAREQARLVLPGFATYYTAQVKVDIHNLLKFLDLRLASDAQWEIREYAKAILHLTEPYFPNIMKWYRESREST